MRVKVLLAGDYIGIVESQKLPFIVQRSSGSAVLQTKIARSLSFETMSDVSLSFSQQGGDGS